LVPSDGSLCKPNGGALIWWQRLLFVVLCGLIVYGAYYFYAKFFPRRK
jgi:hypothetical protein